MAAFDIIALDTATPQLRVPGVADTYNVPRQLIFGAGTNAAPAILIGSTMGIYQRTNGSLNIGAPNQFQIEVVAGEGLRLGASTLSWGITVGESTLVLLRDATDILAQRRGTNAQAFRIYNTFTDASNHERGFAGWVSNVFRIGTEAAGTGAVRAISLATGGTERVNISASGFVTAATIDVVSGGGLTFSGGYELRSSGSLRVSTPSDGVMRVMSWGNVNGAAIESVEMAADPAAPAANAGRMYYRDNGSGKTQLCVRFATGAVQVLATEP